MLSALSRSVMKKRIEAMVTDTIGGAGAAASGKGRRAIGIWLLVLCTMVFVMLVIGGLTRLTHSGLSMVEWKPITGWLPPLSQAEWQLTFEKYQQYPEFQKLNSDMTVGEFKSIFWFEFIHRVWGRLIGVVFILPLIFFALKRWIDRPLVPQLAVIFLLGALQGGMGWYMVMSGLVDRPDVSQYRLTAHLCAAFLINGYMLWVALGLLLSTATAQNRLFRPAVWITCLAFVTVISGGFVAGLDAGFTYNTFPLMDGDLVPAGYLDLQPAYMNLFENIAAVQFNHRLLAIATLLACLWLWWRGRGQYAPGRAGAALNTMVVLVLGQVALGIATLLTVVAVPLAAAHQAVAMVLFCGLVWVVWELRGPPISD